MPNPGRPQREPDHDVEQRLIAAARRHFAERGFAATSLRSIAADAGVTPAMVNYYFDTKQGLFEAVVRQSVQPLLETLRRLAAAPQPGSAGIREIVGAYLGALIAAPWMPRIVVRDVLGREGPAQDFFIREVAAEAAALLPRLLERPGGAPLLRPGIDPRLAILSLIGLCVFPFLAAPVVGPVFGVRPGPEDLDALTDHVCEVFLRGVQA